MSEQRPAHPPQEEQIELGIYQRQTSRRRMAAADAIGIGLSVAWLVVVGGFLLLTGDAGQPLDSLRFVMTLLALFLPVALIWIAIVASRASETMREESNRLQLAIDGIRQTYMSNQAGPSGIKPSVERKLEEIAAAQRKTESAIATFASIRPAAPAEAVTAPKISIAPDPDGQGRLELGTPAEALASPLDALEFIKALNFPENAEDKEGFRALRRALEDRNTSDLIRSSQDVLTMLSQDGIYMDDLRPDRPRPELWRKFAQGERGRAIAGLGGVRDRTCLALSAARMREDAIFRDAVHHFLRRFDGEVSGFVEGASDQDIVELSDTRTARAFMLLGRATGTFT